MPWEKAILFDPEFTKHQRYFHYTTGFVELAPRSETEPVKYCASIFIHSDSDFIAQAGLIACESETYDLFGQVGPTGLLVEIFDDTCGRSLTNKEVDYREFFYTREQLAAWLHPYRFRAAGTVTIRFTNTTTAKLSLRASLLGYKDFGRF